MDNRMMFMYSFQLEQIRQRGKMANTLAKLGKWKLLPMTGGGVVVEEEKIFGIRGLGVLNDLDDVFECNKWRTS